MNDIEFKNKLAKLSIQLNNNFYLLLIYYSVIFALIALIIFAFKENITIKAIVDLIFTGVFLAFFHHFVLFAKNIKVTKRIYRALTLILIFTFIVSMLNVLIS